MPGAPAQTSPCSRAQPQEGSVLSCCGRCTHSWLSPAHPQPAPSLLPCSQDWPVPPLGHGPCHQHMVGPHSWPPFPCGQLLAPGCPTPASTQPWKRQRGCLPANMALPPAAWGLRFPQPQVPTRTICGNLRILQDVRCPTATGPCLGSAFLSDDSPPHPHPRSRAAQHCPPLDATQKAGDQCHDQALAHHTQSPQNPLPPRLLQPCGCDDPGVREQPRLQHSLKGRGCWEGGALPWQLLANLWGP